MAVVNDGTCQQYEVGCMDSLAFNYNNQALLDDGSCEPFIEGCTDPSALNYNEFVNTDDGSCIPAVFGCTDPSMFNYNPEANTYDYSCVSWEEYANDLQAQLDSIVPEDGINQEDVDAVQSELDIVNEALDAAMANQEDGVSQADVDAAFADGVASVEMPECEEVATQNIPLDLPQGWSMFGYTCLESLDVIEAFSGVSDNIEIVKDEWGLAYLPAWGFSAFSNLEFGEGYQIKMIEAVTDFQFCTTIAGGASQDELDAAIAEVHAMYEGWCESDLDNDGICDVDEVSGCMDASSCNYVSEAEFDDGSCDYESCLDECGVINGDNSSCTDACGVINGDNSTCVDECGVPNGDNSSCGGFEDCSGVVNLYLSSDGQLWYTSDEKIAGFQFSHNGMIEQVNGGVASESGFITSASSSLVIGFSLSGVTLPMDLPPLLLINIVPYDVELSISDFVFVGVNGDNLSVCFVGDN